MKSRERARVERHAKRACALVAPDLRLIVCWVSTGLRGAFAECLAHTGEAYIMIDEPLFDLATPDDREDTIRHEIAHAIAWRRHGYSIRPHGREWLRARADLDRALDAPDEV